MKQTGQISVNSENLMPIIKKWLYSDRDIFIRELVSNGTDAIVKHKKLVSMSLAEAADEEKYRIDIRCDKDNGTITFIDNGIGMTREEVEKYITQVAFSGAADFMEKYEKQGAAGDGIIGHFGLGFYSAFMVADRVVIKTRSFQPDAPAVLFESDGEEEYTLDDSEKTDRGTEIILYLNDDSKEFAESGKVKSILLKYCSFMPVEIFVDGADSSINETSPLWLKAPADCTEDEYKSFYHSVFTDINDPLFWIHLNVDYPFSLHGILFFPKLTENIDSMQGQIKLYNNQVFVADNIKEVIPEFLMLLKGVIDCPDMPLNVSRSFLQNDKTVSRISAHITKKVADRLCSMAENEKEVYEKYWDDINVFVKYGCMREEKFAEKMKPHLIYKTTDHDYVTLEKYLETATDKKVYYATNEEAQAHYIDMLKNEGITPLLLGGMLDIPFMQYLEMNTPGISFARVDSDLPGDKSGDALEALCTYAKSALNDEALTVKAEKLNSELPAVILLDEQSRRMEEAQRYYGMNIPLAPRKYTFVLNSANALVEKLNATADCAEKEAAMQQLYDLARLAHGSLSSEDSIRFIQRSISILEKNL